MKEPLTFDDCVCDDGVPNPIGYALPDGPTIEMVACEECGELIEWSLDEPATEAELREVVRSLRADLDQAEDRIQELQEDNSRLREHANALQEGQVVTDATEFRDLVRSKQERIEELERRVADLEDENGRLRRQLASEQQDIEAEDGEADTRRLTQVTQWARGLMPSPATAITAVVTLVMLAVAFAAMDVVMASLSDAALVVDGERTPLVPPRSQRDTVRLAVVTIMALAFLIQHRFLNNGGRFA